MYCFAESKVFRLTETPKLGATARDPEVLVVRPMATA